MPPAARFTRPRGGARGWLARADQQAGGLLGWVAAGRYGPLLTVAAVVLLLLVELAIAAVGAGGEAAPLQRRLVSATSQLTRTKTLLGRQARLLDGWQARARGDERRLVAVTGELQSARRELTVTRVRLRTARQHHNR